MRNPRLAGRYAKSLIDLALEKGQLEVVYKDMLYLQQACKTSKEFVNLLRSPVIKADKKIKILETVTSSNVGELTTAFIRLMIKKGRESNLPEVINAFIEQYKGEKGIQTITLTTAAPVSEKVKQDIISRVKEQTNFKNIDLKEEVKEELIGGFKLEIGDQLIDASILYDLNKVKSQFLNNDFIYKIR